MGLENAFAARRRFFRGCAQRCCGSGAPGMRVESASKAAQAMTTAFIPRSALDKLGDRLVSLSNHSAFSHSRGVVPAPGFLYTPPFRFAKVFRR